MVVRKVLLARRPSWAMWVALWVALFVPTVDPLSCYKCDNCGHWIGDPQPCRPIMNRCMKLVRGDIVDRQCAPQDTCGYGLIQRLGTTLWYRVRQAVSDDPSDTSSAEEIYCCDSDFCNVSQTIAALTAPKMIAVAVAVVCWQQWT